MNNEANVTKQQQTLPDQPAELLSFYEQQFITKQQNTNSHQQTRHGHFAFRVGDINLLIDMSNIAEIVSDMTQITPLPFSPKWLLGIGGLRGEVYSVIDLKQFFKASTGNDSRQKSAYLVLSEQAQGYIFKVDNIIGIRDCDVTELASAQQFFNGQGTIDGETFFRLDIEELTSDSPFIHSMQSN